MRAMIVKAPGGLHNLAMVERDVAKPGPGEVLVRIHAASLNFHDYVVVSKPGRAPDGLIPMSDGAGEVIEVGAGVTEFRPGDNVMSTFFPNWRSGEADWEITRSAITGDTVDGYAAEMVTRPAYWFTKAPANWSHAEAATLPCAALTAWRGLTVQGGVGPGQVVLVQGTGGVSIFGLQLAKAAGATIIATSSSDQKLERLKTLGADHVINYLETPDWADEARAFTGGKGVDRVLEVGGPQTLAQSIKACRMHGKIALIGVLTGYSGEIPTALMALSQLTITGIYVGSREDQTKMVEMLEDSTIRPVIDRIYALSDLIDAFKYQESGAHVGKIVTSL